MEIRHLTRKEQLEWLKGFLESQIKQYQEELEECKKELEEIEAKEYIKTPINNNSNENKN